MSNEELLHEAIRDAVDRDGIPTTEWQAINHKTCTRQQPYYSITSTYNNSIITVNLHSG